MSKGGSGHGAFRKQPTVWPTLPFILITLFQGICCSIVLTVMVFFSYHLKKDNYHIPWQFISLAILSGISLLSVFTVGILFCCRSLNALFAMILESVLSLLWAFGTGILGKGMGGNTIRSCKTWRSSQGIIVCHLYKTLFAFCILGWFSMICGVILASSVRRRASSHKYQPANPASLQQTTAYTPQSGIGQTSVPYGQGGTYKAHDSHTTYS